MSFSPLNFTVLSLYLLAMLAIGVRLARRQRTTEDYFLGGRRLPWLAVAMSMYASVTSAMTFLGLPGMAYKANTALIAVSVMSPVVAPILIFLFYPFYRRLGVTTSYEYVARRFGPAARTAVSVLFLLARLGWLGMVVYAPAMALSVVSGMPLWAAILLMGLLATAYTMLGGLSAVVWTDVAQFVIMIGGAIALAALIARDVPGGAAAILQTAREAGKLRGFDLTWDVGQMTGLAVMVSYFFVLMQDYGVDQVTVQRLLAVRTNRGLARAILFNAATDVAIVALLLFIGIGLFAWAGAHPGAIPEGLAGDRVLPWFIVHRFPDGISGLLITAIFAAAMSSMDSGLNSLSTVIVHDLVRARRALDDTAALRGARGLTLALGVFATGMAFLVTRIGGIVKSFLTIMGLFSAPVLALFLLGMLDRRARFVGWFVGAASAIALTLAAQRFEAMDEIFFFPFSFAVTYVIGALVSRLGRPYAAPAGLTLWDRVGRADEP